MFSLFDIKMDLGLLSGAREPGRQGESGDSREGTDCRRRERQDKEAQGWKKKLPISCFVSIRE